MSQERLAFTFHKLLGSGGFGEVYLASQHTQGGLKRLVAVKVLLATLDENSDAVKRLRDEGKILAMMSHPAILGVHHFTRVDDRLALVTEYVEGIDITEACVPGQLMPRRAALGLVAEVAAALDFAFNTEHPETGRKLKLIHRDIKPENIRISKHGQVKILDFGIARSSEMERHAKTAMGDVLMTPGYGAPEALAFGVTSHKVDVYALGATLFRLITGEKLFGNRPIDFQLTIAMDTQDYGEFLTERLKVITGERLRELLRVMLAFQPEHRPDAAEVCDIAEELVRREPGLTVGQWARSHEFESIHAQIEAGGGEGLEGKSMTVSGVVSEVRARLISEGIIPEKTPPNGAIAPLQEALKTPGVTKAETISSAPTAHGSPSGARGRVSTAAPSRPARESADAGRVNQRRRSLPPKKVTEPEPKAKNNALLVVAALSGVFVLFLGVIALVVALLYIL